MDMKNLLKELEDIAVASAASFGMALSTQYLNRAMGVPGAPPITAGNIGKLAGIVGATAALQHLAAAAAQATGGPTQ